MDESSTPATSLSQNSAIESQSLRGRRTAGKKSQKERKRSGDAFTREMGRRSFFFGERRGKCFEGDSRVATADAGDDDVVTLHGWKGLSRLAFSIKRTDGVLSEGLWTQESCVRVGGCVWRRRRQVLPPVGEQRRLPSTRHLRWNRDASAAAAKKARTERQSLSVLVRVRVERQG